MTRVETWELGGGAACHFPGVPQRALSPAASERGCAPRWEP